MLSKEDFLKIIYNDGLPLKYTSSIDKAESFYDNWILLNENQQQILAKEITVAPSRYLWERFCETWTEGKEQLQSLGPPKTFEDVVKIIEFLRFPGTPIKSSDSTEEILKFACRGTRAISVFTGLFNSPDPRDPYSAFIAVWDSWAESMRKVQGVL